MVVGCASPVLVDMVGPQNISAAFSGILALCGLSSLIGPPLAGDMVSSVRDIKEHQGLSYTYIRYL